MSNNGNKNSLYNLTETLLKKYNLPTTLKIPLKIQNNHAGVYKGIFLDKKTKYKNPRYILKIHKPN